MPVPSQVVLHNTISRGKNLRSIVNKILIQINAKLGGEPWAVSGMPFTSKPTMVCGYDVFHKPKANSYLAFCGTVNRNFNQYWSAYIQQREYQEIADKLQSVVSEALDAFKTSNGIYPSQVIFYRDGVGEQQKKAIMTGEVEQIKQALLNKKDKDGGDIKITFVMVNKRVKTKLVLENQGRIQNPPPGTVLDHSLTAKGGYDFYLVSQHCRVGVPTPSHYTVLYDEIKADPKDLMGMTYKLTFTYFNFSGSVKIPAPVKYADKMAMLMGDRKIQTPHVAYKSRRGLYFI